MQRAKSEYAIQTVTNALRVLEAFETDEQLGVTELARRLDLHKNNVFRLLATLEEKQWVEQTDAELYRLGASCLRLSQAYTRTRLADPPRAPRARGALPRDRRDGASRRCCATSRSCTSTASSRPA